MASVESYKHRAAKAVLTGWLREAAAGVGGNDYARFAGMTWRVNRPGPTWGVYEEYPVSRGILHHGSVLAWDEMRPAGVPTYDELIAEGDGPICIFDVAVQHKGIITHAFEVVHTSPPSPEKIRFLSEIDVCTVVIDAEWILRQVAPPARVQICAAYGTTDLLMVA